MSSCTTSLGKESSWNISLNYSGIYTGCLALFDDIESLVNAIVCANSCRSHQNFLLVLKSRIHESRIVQCANLKLVFTRRYAFIPRWTSRTIRSTVINFHIWIIACVGIRVLDVYSSSLVRFFHAVNVLINIRISINFSRDFLRCGASVHLLLKNVMVLLIM